MEENTLIEDPPLVEPVPDAVWTPEPVCEAVSSVPAVPAEPNVHPLIMAALRPFLGGAGR